MGRKWHRLAGLVTVPFLSAIAFLPQAASALDTANVLMNIDGMVITHQGLFRNFTPADGAQTFSYGIFNTVAGTQGRYKSFFLVVPVAQPTMTAAASAIVSGWSPGGRRTFWMRELQRIMQMILTVLSLESILPKTISRPSIAPVSAR